jgi:hypothetical protein
MTGHGYEFCNCDFGCGCNFGGFPNSKDGSCRALVGLTITKGRCGEMDLAGVKCAAICEWPKAIHESDGKAAFIFDPSTVYDVATSDFQPTSVRAISARWRQKAIVIER